MESSRWTPAKKTLYRRSRQRERMLQILRSTESHPTASWLYARLRREFPSLSLGTVYRNIGILIEQGLIKKIASGSTFDRLDANIEPHYHFVCEVCGAFHDLQIPPGGVLTRRMKVPRGFSITSHVIELHGVCAKCAAKA
jgi:Fur family peroxide stress response transcriptional regulator